MFHWIRKLRIWMMMMINYWKNPDEFDEISYLINKETNNSSLSILEKIPKFQIIRVDSGVKGYTSSVVKAVRKMVNENHSQYHEWFSEIHDISEELEQIIRSTPNNHRQSMDIVEIHLLWTRFIQLGCNPQTGLWNARDANKAPGRISKSEIQVELLSKLLAPEKTALSFLEFINSVKWLSKSTTNDKYKACYGIINNNQPITKPALTKFLKSLLAYKTASEITSLVNNLFTYVKTEEKATSEITSISEDAFVNYLQNHMNLKQFEKFLSIDILPAALTKETNDKPANKKKMMNSKETSKTLTFATYNTIPTDEELQLIAKIIISDIRQQDNSKNDELSRLASILGLLPFDLAHLDAVHRGDELKILTSCLREWRLREGARAMLSVLFRSLHLVGLDKTVLDIQMEMNNQDEGQDNGGQ